MVVGIAAMLTARAENMKESNSFEKRSRVSP